MNRLQHVRKVIDVCDFDYHVRGVSSLTDAQYDALKKELMQLAPGDQRLTRVGSPTLDAMRTKFKHECFMGSLVKCDDPSELADWHSKCVAQAGTYPQTIHASLKLDGASLALYYEDGVLRRAVTRGSEGEIGEDVTANAIKAKNVPTHLSGPAERATLAVRGEMVLLVDDWMQIDIDRDSNPRNIGNGILGRTDGTNADALSFYAFDVMETSKPFPTEILTESDKEEFLKTIGFTVVESACDMDVELAKAFHRQTAERRASLPFWIDGVVFKLESVPLQKRLGYQDAGKRPRGQRVLKFEAEGAETTLLAVETTYGHTGAIIPTGKLEPVRIGGTTVSSVLLNNFQMIKDLDLAIGDKVRVIKAKDIIPMLQEVVDRTYVCPECGFSGTLEQQNAHHKSI